MIFKFAVGSGSPFAFQVNQSTLNSMKRQSVYNRRGKRRSRVVTMMVTGRILYDGAAAITAAVNALENAFLADLTLGSTCGLYLNDGTTATSHTLDSTGSMDGIRVRQLLWDKRLAAGEYANGRSFSIVLEAEYPQPGLGGQIQEWRETVRTVGTGGARNRHVEHFTGNPTKYQVNAATLQYIYQEGFTIGMTAWPEGAVPPSLLPDEEDLRQIENIWPDPRAMGYFDFGMRWRYVMVLGGTAAVTPPKPNQPVIT